MRRVSSSDTVDILGSCRYVQPISAPAYCCWLSSMQRPLLCVAIEPSVLIYFRKAFQFSCMLDFVDLVSCSAFRIWFAFLCMRFAFYACGLLLYWTLLLAKLYAPSSSLCCDWIISTDLFSKDFSIQLYIRFYRFSVVFCFLHVVCLLCMFLYWSILVRCR